jgi:hypothetical protein
MATQTFPNTFSAPLEHPPVVERKASSDLETQSHQNDMNIIKIGAAQEFDGPDDPDDPLNWPAWKKVYHTTMVGLLGFTMYALITLESSSITHLRCLTLTQHPSLIHLLSSYT